MPTEEQVRDLAEAVWQALDDMGREGRGVCAYTKARLRLAYQPFHVPDNDGEMDMSLQDAQQIIDSVP